MKKILLTILAIYLALFSYSQCMPDSSITSPGIFPDEITAVQIAEKVSNSCLIFKSFN